MKFVPFFRFAGAFRRGGLVDPNGPRTVGDAARELGRLGGQAIGRRRHLEAEARHHTEHERMKAIARRLRADCRLPPKPILEPADFNQGA